MTLKEKEKLIKDMKAYAKKVASNKKEAQKFITSTGIYTPKGNLTKAYKS